MIILLFFLPLSAFAQIRDISVLAGVNVPMDRGVESDAVIAVNYGQFSHSTDSSATAAWDSASEPSGALPSPI